MGDSAMRARLTAGTLAILAASFPLATQADGPPRKRPVVQTPQRATAQRAPVVRRPAARLMSPKPDPYPVKRYYHCPKGTQTTNTPDPDDQKCTAYHSGDAELPVRYVCDTTVLRFELECSRIDPGTINDGNPVPLPTEMICPGDPRCD